MIDKPRYRYNWTTNIWDQVFRINTDVAFISQWRNPDGSHRTFTLPHDSPLVDFYRKNPQVV